MISWGEAGSAGPLLVAGAALLGLILSPVAEWLIFRLLPRLGGLPARRTRITTAIVTGTACAAFALRFGSDSALPAFILMGVLGVQLARIDISLHLLPNPLVLLLLLAGAGLFIVSILTGGPWPDVLRAVAGGTILAVFYLILAIISPGAIGMGDVKLAGPLGLYLGYLGWSQVLYGALLGFVLNGIFTLFVVLKNRPLKPSEVAHGPSMLASVLCISLLSS
ncbi:prepilin peptidase [Pseudarthrobacter sp. CCNWLW207]|uniref:prepilin peptidase n=1 Tax=Pseudarthrobacter sp. CCNWLW207 TaxID=3127468 RepID=UPI00307793C9